mmetsp:Transcript_28848/g.84570  ORF Transcript_28848/g.84570 Transcript_28848/m.84570 type:complete len:210 (-) Transcript_28848:188-817(-)
MASASVSSAPIAARSSLPSASRCCCFLRSEVILFSKCITFPEVSCTTLAPSVSRWNPSRKSSITFPPWMTPRADMLVSSGGSLPLTIRRCCAMVAPVTPDMHILMSLAVPSDRMRTAWDLPAATTVTGKSPASASSSFLRVHVVGVVAGVSTAPMERSCNWMADCAADAAAFAVEGFEGVNPLKRSINLDPVTIPASASSCVSPRSFAL